MIKTDAAARQAGREAGKHMHNTSASDCMREERYLNEHWQLVHCVDGAQNAHNCGCLCLCCLHLLDACYVLDVIA